MSIQNLRNKWENEISEKLTSLSFKDWLIKQYNNSHNVIVVDLNVIKNKLIENNILSVEDGWTNAIMDILEDNYQLETRLQKLLPEISH